MRTARPPRSPHPRRSHPRIDLALSDELRNLGGHLGDDVRPSAHGRGHNGAILAAAFGIAAQHGIGEVLLT